MQDCRLQVSEINQGNNIKLKGQEIIEKLKKFLFKRMKYNKLLKAWKKNKFKH
jgi:hypothetical protein